MQLNKQIRTEKEMTFFIIDVIAATTGIVYFTDKFN